MADQNTPAYYTTMAVSKLFQDDAMRQEFMNIYTESTKAAQDFLVDNLNIPEEMAGQIVSKQGDDLNNFVGKNVCTYLW